MHDETHIPEEEAEKGTEENPMTREEAIAAGIDVDKVEAEAVPFEEEEETEEDHA